VTNFLFFVLIVFFVVVDYQLLRAFAALLFFLSRIGHEIFIEF